MKMILITFQRIARMYGAAFPQLLRCYLVLWLSSTLVSFMREFRKELHQQLTKFECQHQSY